MKAAVISIAIGLSFSFAAAAAQENAPAAAQAKMGLGVRIMTRNGLKDFLGIGAYGDEASLKKLAAAARDIQAIPQDIMENNGRLELRIFLTSDVAPVDADMLVKRIDGGEFGPLGITSLLMFPVQEQQ